MSTRVWASAEGAAAAAVAAVAALAAASCAAAARLGLVCVQSPLVRLAPVLRRAAAAVQRTVFVVGLLLVVAGQVVP